jgi:integrase
LKAWQNGGDHLWLDTPDPQLIRDYLVLILFTGLRRGEAAKLRWEWVDLDHRTLTIPATETKNGHAHSLPLSDYLTELLTTRKHADSTYVFPGRGKTGHFTEPKKPIIKIRERSGVEFTLHDLRRTFITIAESLNIRDYTLKRLLNHRSSGDVTDGYIMSDVERLREPMNAISNSILAYTAEEDP